MESPHDHPLLDSLDKLIDLLGANGCAMSIYRNGTIKVVKLTFLEKKDAQLVGRCLKSRGFQEITIRQNTMAGNWLMTADWVPK